MGGAHRELGNSEYSKHANQATRSQMPPSGVATAIRPSLKGSAKPFQSRFNPQLQDRATFDDAGGHHLVDHGVEYGPLEPGPGLLVAATLAHNLIRWTQLLGTPEASRLANAKTFRRRLLSIPSRLTRSARHWTLHLPSRWHWQYVFQDTLHRLRALPSLM